MLALAAVRRQEHGVPIAAFERLIEVQHGLDLVLPGSNLREALRGIAEGARIHDRRLARGQVEHVHPKICCESMPSWIWKRGSFTGSRDRRT